MRALHASDEGRTPAAWRLLATTISLIIVALLPGTIHAASGKPEWGKVAAEEFALEPPPGLPHAAAVIIFESGDLEIGVQDYKLKVYRRIKVFNRQAIQSLINAEVVVGKDEHFGGFSAQTLLPNGTKIAHSDVLKRKVGKSIEIVTFTFNGVEDGCVIEYKYEVRGWQLKPSFGWVFQNEFYTIESRCALATNPYLIFQVIAIGVGDTIAAPTEERTHVDQESTLRRTWRMTRVPPDPAEPYPAAQLNSRPSIFFQFAGVNIPDFKVNFLKDWPALAELLSEDFAWVFENCASLRQIMPSRSAVSTADSALLLRELFGFVRDSIAAHDEALYDLIPSRRVEEIIQRRTGNSSERVCALIGLLRAYGFKADPVLIGTRDHVRFMPRVVNMRQFNAVLCRVVTGDSVLWLHPDTDFPFPYMNPAFHVNMGLMVSDSTGDTVSISRMPKWPSQRKTIAQIWLDVHGAARCSVYVATYGYSQMIESAVKADTIGAEQVLDLLPGLHEQQIELLDSRREIDASGDSATYRLVFNAPRFAIVEGGHVAITPLLSLSGESPWVVDERQYAIDYLFPFVISETIDLHLPETMPIATPPKNAAASIPGMMFSRSLLAAESSAKVMTQLIVRETFYEPDSYLEVRNFFDKYVTALTEPVTATVR